MDTSLIEHKKRRYINALLHLNEYFPEHFDFIENMRIKLSNDKCKVCDGKKSVILREMTSDGKYYRETNIICPECRNK